MSLGKVLEVTGFSQISGYKYRVEVLKEGYTDQVIKPETTSRIFTLSYEPDTDDVAANLCPSTVEFDIYETPDNTSRVQSFIETLLQFQQEDYYCRIYKTEPAQSEELFWVGIVLQDETSEQDVSPAAGKIHTITAGDGLTTLKNKKYIFGNTPDYTTPVFSSTTLQEIIRKAISRAVDGELWSETEPYLITSFDWTPTLFVYDDRIDALTNIHFDVNAFLDKETLVTIDRVNGEPFDITAFIRPSCYEVLESLAKALFCRIYMANGVYHFEQISSRAANSITRYKYNKRNDYLGVFLDTSNSVLINKNRGSIKYADGEYTSLPGLKKVIVEQKSYNSEYTLTTEYPVANFVYTFNGPFVYETDIGLFGEFIQNTPIANAIRQRLEIVVTFDCEHDITVPDDGDPAGWIRAYNMQYVYSFKQRVELEVILTGSNTGNTYYTDGLSWSTSFQNLELDGDEDLQLYFDNRRVDSTLKRGTQRTIQTPPLPETGRVQVRLLAADVRQLRSVGPKTWSSIDAAYVVSAQGTGVKASFKSVYNDNTSAVRFYSLTNSNSNIGDNEQVTIDNVVLGDGALQTGHLVAFNSLTAEYNKLPSWRYKTDTDNYSLAGLLAKERLRIQDQPMEIFNGNINWLGNYQFNVKIDDGVYMPQEVEYNAGTEVMSGTYYLMERLEVAGNPQGELGPGIRIAGASTGNRNGKFKFGNISVGKSEVADTFYGLNETVQSNNIRHEKSERIAVRGEEVGDGLMILVSENDRFVKLSWSGGNGQAILVLPEYSSELDGMNLQIVLDETFSTAGNETVSVTTNGSTNVRGGTEVALAQKESREQNWFTLTEYGWY